MSEARLPRYVRRGRPSPGPAWAILTLFWVANAWAQNPEEVARADALFDAGKSELSRGDWAAACALFRSSLALDASVSTRVKVARCLVNEGRLAAALDEYDRAFESTVGAGLPEARQQELQAVIRSESAELEARVPKLAVVVRPETTAITALLDGHEVSPGSLAELRLDPGTHEIVIRAPGFRDHRAAVEAKAGILAKFYVNLEPVASSPTILQPRTVTPAREAKRRGTTTPDQSTTSGSNQRVLGAIVGGAGLASLVVAGVFGIRTLALVDDSRDHCTPGTNECSQTGVDLVDQASRSQNIGFLLGGLGAALLGTGVILYVTAPAQSGSGHARALQPSVSIGGSF